MTIITPGDAPAAVTKITSNDGSVTITNPTGPTADLSASKGGYTLIAKSVLSAPAATFVFNSITQSFNNLSVRVMGRSSKNAGDDQVYCLLNGDGSSIYSNQIIDASNTTLTGHQTSSNPGWITYGGGNGTIPAATATAGYVGFAEFELPAYTLATLFKCVRWITGFMVPGLGAFLETGVGSWPTAAAVTEVTLGIESGSNWVTGSAAYLYGF